MSLTDTELEGHKETMQWNYLILEIKNQNYKDTCNYYKQSSVWKLDSNWSGVEFTVLIDLKGFWIYHIG